MIDNPGTTLSIAMAANIPTICYWDSKTTLLCKYTEPITSALMKAGILFNSENEAATKVNEIWNDVDAWWAQKEIQEVRRNFCWNYARTNKFWLIEWMKTLFKL